MEWGFKLKSEQNTATPQIPDSAFYRRFSTDNYSVFSPWLGYGDFSARYREIQPYTVVSDDRCYVLCTLAAQAAGLDGQWYECGVFQGGTAMMLARLLAEKSKKSDNRLHLFDTFEGMPETDKELDLHSGGDFANTSAEEVRERVEKLAPGQVALHQGFIPKTFTGLEEHEIALAHIDVDIFRSIIDCCEFIYPRLVSGGFMIFDDYGFDSCPGARKAVDEFFADKPEFPLVLPTGQAILFKSK